MTRRILAGVYLAVSPVLFWLAGGCVELLLDQAFSMWDRSMITGVLYFALTLSCCLLCWYATWAVAVRAFVPPAEQHLYTFKRPPEPIPPLYRAISFLAGPSFVTCLSNGSGAIHELMTDGYLSDGVLFLLVLVLGACYALLIGGAVMLYRAKRAAAGAGR